MRRKVRNTGIIATLKGRQRESIHFLSERLMSRDTCAVLQGYAGTGKTYCCRAFAEIYASEVFLFTAPTNKAAQVLELALGEDYKVRTTFSILGLKPDSGSINKRLIQKLSAAQSKVLEGISVLVVDEGSMIGELEDLEADDGSDDYQWEDEERMTGELLDFILDAAKRFHFKVIFLGDPLQLPPPSSDSGESPVFEKGYPTFLLTDVIRHEGDILNFVMAIRQAIVTGMGIFPLPERYNIEMMKFYTPTRLKEDMDSYLDGSLRMIAFTNATVDGFNNLVREVHYGKDAGELRIEDRVLFVNPLLDVSHLDTLKDPLECPIDNPAGWDKDANFKIIAPIDSQAEVVNITIEVKYGLPVYVVDLRIDGGTNATAYMVGKSSAIRLEEMVRELEIQSAAAFRSREAIKVLNHFKELFLPIKFAYAITSHRAQGSTFDKVIVDAGDIMKMRSNKTALRSAYVGASRAKDHLRILWRS